VTIHW